MKCPKCGAARSAGDRFCALCGAPLAESRGSQDHTGALSPVEDATGELPAVGEDLLGVLSAGDAVLVVLRGPDAGARFLLTGGVGTVVTAGRGQDASIFLDDVTVSRRHVEFRRTESDWVLVDVGSLNGTYVNKSRIDEQTLSDSDEVQVGKYRFVVRIAEDS
jgi:pSer/pThr/pTyr-binding forkhead associated (FHA) protein